MNAGIIRLRLTVLVGLTGCAEPEPAKDGTSDEAQDTEVNDELRASKDSFSEKMDGYTLGPNTPDKTHGDRTAA